MPSTTHQYETLVSPALLTDSQHYEIFQAMDETRRLYDEISTTPLLIDSINGIFESAQLHFREEENLLLQLQQDNFSLGAHRELHKRMLNQIVSMRRHIERFDRGNFVFQLRYLEEWLNTHISDEALQFPLKNS